MNTGSQRRRAVVIGAGMGGLAGAIHLAATGWEVDLFEAAPSVGGKMRQVASGQSRIDAGPTVLTLRQVFDDLFSISGGSLEDHVRLTPMHILARHQWRDGSRLDLFADPAASRRAIEDFAGRAEADAFGRFLAYARTIWETVEGPFVRAQRPTPFGILKSHGLSALPLLMKVDSRRTVWKALESFFRDPRLVQLFGRYATYTGCSPFLAPATLNLVAWVETQGVWRVEGGMHVLACALRDLLISVGGRVHLASPVAEIRLRGGRAAGVALRSGDVVEADAVLFAGDVSALGLGLLGRDARHAVDPVPESNRSLSALTWCVEAETRGFPLVHHNVFFGESSAGEFGAIFGERRLPSRPTVYICAQDRDDRAEAGGHERLLMLVNAPATADVAPPGAEELERCRQDTFAQLQQAGLDIRPTGDLVRTSPTEFHQLFPASGGALYGAATHSWTATLERHPARTRLPGLYLAGGTVHPGAGVPMAATSGRLAAEAMSADRPSTSTSRAVATPGGTWTRSATAAASR
jgi:1-hydroxycarotenoid 3,4-desaturase